MIFNLSDVRPLSVAAVVVAQRRAARLHRLEQILEMTVKFHRNEAILEHNLDEVVRRGTA